jgi:hypothetical protein
METSVNRLRTHQKNIDHYQGLLKTKLNETERLFLRKRVCEEMRAMLRLMEQRSRSMRSLTLPPRGIGSIET